MSAGSLIGFGLVFLLVSMLISLLASGLLTVLSKRLRLMGPMIERRAAALALVLPPLAGIIVSVTIALSKLLAYYNGQDHCLGHGHHLHLCPIHGAHWLSEPWALATIAFFGTFLLIRIGQTIWRHVDAQLMMARLIRVADPASDFELTFIVPGEDHFAFTAGVFRPKIIISRAAWNALDSAQRRAVVSHELAHIRNGDLWKRAVLGLLSCFGVPVLTRRALTLWEVASERVSDNEAAHQVGKPSIVASAILRLARATSMRQAPSTAIFAAACHVSDRIHSLFNHPDGDESSTKKLLIILAAATGAFLLSLVLFADGIHHFFETVIG